MEKAVLKLLLGLLVAALLTCIVVWRWQRGAKPAPASAPALQTAGTNAPALTSASPGQNTQGLAETLRSVSEASQAGQGSATGEQLARLRQALSAAGKEEASTAIRQFLESKSDAQTGQGFKLGAHGFLEHAPTLRTFLLDYLGQTDPAAAAAYARVILNSKDSPDEWAVALRSLALGDASAAGRAVLEDKTGELLRHEPWQQGPSAGYLEAFDAAVYLGGTKLVPALGELIRKQDNPAVAHAAFLALDRMVINQPATILAVLAADPELMQGREQTRANYFARADVRDPQQRQILENYLLDGRFSAAERQQFAGLYPSANFMISQNLLTPTPTPDHAALVSRDAQSLQVVQEWLADPRFASLRPQLEKTKTRLEEFARQASGK